MGPDAMILAFWMLSFKPTFSLSSFTFIKMLFSSSFSAISVVSSEYLRLLIFLPAILNPACASSSPVFLMIYSATILDLDYTKEVLTLLHSSRAHNRFPNLGTWQRAWKPEFDFEGQRDLITKLPKDWGNRLFEGRTKPCVHQAGTGAVTLQEAEPNLPVTVQPLMEVWVNCGLPQDQGHWPQQSWELHCTGVSP